MNVKTLQKKKMNKHELNSKDFNLSEIESIELIGDTETIDITVDDTHMFFANDVYSHNSGAHDNVIEGDKAAGSYNKMMIADFAMSLSRKRQDKVNGTGRIHIMKNRYGSDVMTYEAKVNTNCGKIEINSEAMDEDEIQAMQQATNTANNNSFKSSISTEEKKYLSNKFFELSK
jgi:DNA-binding protein YbaB